MKQVLLVGAGGFLGAVARHLVTLFTHSITPGKFPLGTLSVNVLGSFLLGLIAVRYFSSTGSSPGMGLFLMTGFLGAFTTFSTFSYESLTLYQEGMEPLFLGNVALNLILCLGAAWTGMVLGYSA